MLSIRPGEGRALLLAFGYFFFLLAAYYVLRPVRDEMGVRSGVRSLATLFTWTCVVSLAIAPIFGFLVAKLRRRLFVPLVYGFLLLNILGFWIALSGDVALGLTARIFFVWITIFSVLGVSVFWSFMADLFDPDQAKRLYPTIAVGGNLGGFAGAAMVTGLAKSIGPANLLLVAAVLLALAMACAMALDRKASQGEIPDPDAVTEAETKVGGGWLEGPRAILSSRYLGGLSIWVFLLSLAATLAYYQQTAIVGAADMTSGERTAFFGRIDLIANLINPLLQITVTRWALNRLGVGPTLAVVAVVFAVGLGALAAAPMLATLFWFQIAQRAGQFALSNPAREALWTVVDRENKYKAKNVVDNAVFRGADLINAWLYNLATGPMLALGLGALSWVVVPFMAVWAWLSLRLGREHARRSADPHPQSP